MSDFETILDFWIEFKTSPTIWERYLQVFVRIELISDLICEI